MNGNGPRSERRAHLQRKSSSKKGRRAKVLVQGPSTKAKAKR